MLKPRHERFCRQFVDCMNATAAAKAAGYRPASARNAGYRLLRQPQIVRRIIELQHETAATHCRDANVLLGKLETIYRRAVDDRQLAAAARAVELQAKLSGLAPTDFALTEPPHRSPNTATPRENDADISADDAPGRPAGNAVLAALTTERALLEPHEAVETDPTSSQTPEHDIGQTLAFDRGYDPDASDPDDGNSQPEAARG